MVEGDIYSPETTEELPTRPDTRLKARIQYPNHLAESGSLSFAHLPGPLSVESPEGAAYAQLQIHRDQAKPAKNTDWWPFQKEPVGIHFCLFYMVYVWTEGSPGAPSFESAKLWGCKNP